MRARKGEWVTDRVNNLSCPFILTWLPCPEVPRPRHRSVSRVWTRFGAVQVHCCSLSVSETQVPRNEYVRRSGRTLETTSTWSLGWIWALVRTSIAISFFNWTYNPTFFNKKMVGTSQIGLVLASWGLLSPDRPKRSGSTTRQRAGFWFGCLSVKHYTSMLLSREAGKPGGAPASVECPRMQHCGCGAHFYIFFHG